MSGLSTLPVFTELCRTDPHVAISYYGALASYNTALFSGGGGGKVDVSGFGGWRGCVPCVLRMVGGDGVSSFAPRLESGGDVDCGTAFGAGNVGACDADDGVQRNSSKVASVTPVLLRNQEPAVGSSAVRDDSGFESEGLGKNTLRNRQWRKERKERKCRKRGFGLRSSQFVASGRGFFDDCSEETRRVLRETRAERLSVQNRLEKAKAERQLELLNASDLELEKKRHSTQVKAQTEKNMAAIERTHAYLSSTGNVPGEGILHHDHDVHTVVGSVPGSSANLSGSISPNSSASQAEFLACQKKLLDSEKLIRDMSAAFKKLGISFEAAGALDKQTFTDTPENAMIVDELYPDDHGVVHYVQRGDQRKFKVGPDDYYEG